MKRKILFLSLLSLLQFLLIHFVLIQGFANSGDEQALLFQGKLIARGQLYVEDPIYDHANPFNKYVAADAMDDSGGRRFAKYAPGWPALLSLGVPLRAEWLVAPVLGALTVFLLLSYVRGRIGEEFVPTTWWLVTLCAFFGFSVANFGTHTATMACLFAAFFVYNGTVDERQSEHSHWRLFAVGLLLGYCALIRYLDCFRPVAPAKNQRTGSGSAWIRSAGVRSPVLQSCPYWKRIPAALRPRRKQSGNQPGHLLVGLHG
jgi:hypothetical protein